MACIFCPSETGFKKMECQKCNILCCAFHCLPSDELDNRLRYCPDCIKMLDAKECFICSIFDFGKPLISNKKCANCSLKICEQHGQVCPGCKGTICDKCGYHPSCHTC